MVNEAYPKHLLSIALSQYPQGGTDSCFRRSDLEVFTKGSLFLHLSIRALRGDL